MSAALLRRLNKVESTLLDDDGKPRGGVMLVPPIMYGNLEGWERRAMAEQQALARAAREDIDRCNPPKPHAEPLPHALTPLIEGVHFHRPDPHRNQAPVPKRPPLPPTAPMIR